MKIVQNHGGSFSVEFLDQSKHRRRQKIRGAKTAEEALEMAKNANIPAIQAATMDNTLYLHQAVLSLALHGKHMTVWKAAELYREWAKSRRASATIRRLDGILGTFCQRFGTKLLNELTAADTDAFFNAPRNNGHSAKLTTRQLHYNGIINFLKWCHTRRLLFNYDPIEVHIRVADLSHEDKEKKIPIPFTLEQVQKMLKHRLCHHGSFWRFAIIVGWKLGLRMSDVVGLEWAAVKQGVIWTRKTGKRITVPFDDELKAEVSRLHSSCPRYVFPTERAVYEVDGPGFLNHFKTIAKFAGVKNAVYRAFRYGFAQHVTETQGIEYAKKLMGHTFTGTTEIYLREREEATKDVLLEPTIMRSINGEAKPTVGDATP